jgi:hypothetical protein
MIRQFGTTDSFSTEPVSFSLSLVIFGFDSVILWTQGELEHRTTKARYKRTDRKRYVRQLAQIERQEARLRQIKEKLRMHRQEQGEVVAKSMEEHHHIGVSQRQYYHIGTFLQRNSGDPAAKVAISVIFIAA